MGMNCSICHSNLHTTGEHIGAEEFRVGKKLTEEECKEIWRKSGGVLRRIKKNRRQDFK